MTTVRIIGDLLNKIGYVDFKLAKTIADICCDA